MLSIPYLCSLFFFFFFFNDPATTEIYTLPLHDALPISVGSLPTTLHLLATGASPAPSGCLLFMATFSSRGALSAGDRKSTRLNSSHLVISYAVFCLKKKKQRNHHRFHTSISTAHR